MNYLSKPPLLVDEYYYDKDAYAVNDQTGRFQPNIQGSNQKNWCQKETKVVTMVITTERVNMFEMGTTTVKITLTK